MWIWRPPLHFMLVSPVNGAPVTFDDAVKEAVRRKMKVTPDMGNLLRVCSRLEGGGRDANLKQMSVSLTFRLPHLDTRTSAPWHSPRATGSPI